MATTTVPAARIAAPALTAAAALSAVAFGLTGPVREHCARAAGQATRAKGHLPGTDAHVARAAIDDLARTLDDICGIAAAYARIAGDPIAARTLPGDALPLGQEMTAAIARRADHATRVVDYLAALHAQRARAVTSAGADRYRDGYYEPGRQGGAGPAGTVADQPGGLGGICAPAASATTDPLPGVVALAGLFFAVLIIFLLLSRCGSGPTTHALPSSLTYAVQTWSTR